MPRRDFVKIMSVSAASMSLRVASAGSLLQPAEPAPEVTTIRGAFLYPPTAVLEKAGYCSWPGSDFDAEGRQQRYRRRARPSSRSSVVLQ